MRNIIGAHIISDQEGTTRYSRMDQKEYDQWNEETLTVRIGDLKIIPKRDFGQYGFYDALTRTNLKEGWNVVHDNGPYTGAQAMPGGVWGRTLAEAQRLIHAFTAAGCDDLEDQKAGGRFHALLALTRVEEDTTQLSREEAVSPPDAVSLDGATRGPWRVKLGEDDAFIIGPSGEHIAYLGTSKAMLDTGDELQQNARLIVDAVNKLREGNAEVRVRESSAI